ncbi:MAG: DNA translocase FtsK 4TM domain-containing protein [Alphaproteobacteria bacterium]|nr:DNA translocase FtsK 4TM domain-containing protein [Alphaproteobacteria bacterium]
MNKRSPEIAIENEKPRNPLYVLAGSVLVIVCIYIALCLMTYHPADPSLNRAASGIISNAGGTLGAYTADLLLQVMGLASMLVVLVPLAWGIKLFRGQKIYYMWMRSSFLLMTIVVTTALVAGIEPPLSWPINSGFGGTMGSLLHDMFYDMFKHTLFVVALLSFDLVTLSLAFGMSLSEWRVVLAAIRNSATVVGNLARALMPNRPSELDNVEFEEEELRGWREKLMFWRRGAENEEEYEDEDEPRVPRVRKKAPSMESDKPSRQAPKVQSALALPQGDYELPSVKLLTSPPKSRKSGLSESALTQNAKLLETVLQDFGVNGDITEIRPGPVVTLYELEPAAGTKSSRVVGLADDIARSMSAVSARIAVIPGRNAIGIELPNSSRETVYFREMLENEAFEGTEAKLPIALGKDIGGQPIIVDLSKMPHLLVAGTTGSGKSVAINTMICSLVYRLTPEECKFIMIDPKMLELSVYEGIPHLLTSVVTEPGKAVVALKWTVKEMENRYRLMSNLGVRNIEGYNKKIREAKAKGHELTRTVQTGFDPDSGEPIIEEVPLDMNDLPFIVVVVDEMADLMIVAGKEIEGSIQRLAQMARAAGIHIIMATQRPSVDVITGVIKANFPTRISFQVTSRIDSRTILGEQGAEQLLGQGDMLYMAGGGRITRVHGPFVSDKEVEHVVKHLKAQGEPTYIEDVTKDESEEGAFGEEAEKDAMYDQAVAIVVRDKKASTSYVQRCLKIGYNRAASIIEMMEREGIVGPANHVGKREVLVDDV